MPGRNEGKQIECEVETEVGFANGRMPNLLYEEVYTDTTGHAETVRVKYNPDVVSLEGPQNYLDKNPTGYCHPPQSLF